MKKQINKAIRGITGYQLVKASRDHVFDLLGSKWFKSFDFKTVLDVGANNGQFAKSTRKAMPHIRIISFEPIPRECEALKNAFGEDKNYQVFQMALGSEKGETKFLVNEFSPTSSLLEQSDLQKEYYPITGESTEISVTINRLDNVLELRKEDQNVLLKIDVQGFEKEVLLGAEGLLDKIALIYVECSFKEFYKGQPLFHEIYELLYKKGFVFKGVGDQLMAGKKGEPTQVDAIFVNQKFE